MRGPAAESYLSTGKLIAAAKDSGAGAVHPGYGFLSENADFAAACGKAGLVFIGPPAEVIARMGNKAEAKRAMTKAGIPCLPGYAGADQSDKTLAAEARKIGYPVMIKAAAGGGGRGMRLVEGSAELAAALRLARSEALNAFGSGELILERALPCARHVEIQILADRHGNVVHLGERDCSVQRRHQKVVEEAPCPAMTPELRAAMGGAAIKAARAVGYEGAGTVEFLLDESGGFYFLEMNTRLQVEHPVTELVTGRDLVALQFAVARGEPLGFAQCDVALSGHAVEARLYAEDPAQDFLPSTGVICRWRPGAGAGIRIDSGITEGQEVSPFYDPLLAKIIARGATREEARQRLVASLRDTVLFGPASNRDFLIEVLENGTFARGEATTAFLSQEFGAPIGDMLVPTFADIAAVAALIHADDAAAALASAVDVVPDLLGWSSSGQLKAGLRLGHGDRQWTLWLTSERDGHLTVTDGTETATCTTAPLRVDGVRCDLRAFHRVGSGAYLATGTKTVAVRILRAGASAGAGGDGIVSAPMHGNLLEVFVKPGDHVEPGTRLAVLEAMKMQQEILSGVAGRVRQISAPAQVKAGDLIVEIEVDAA